MPIQFPPSKRDNPFDRWQWVSTGIKPPQQQVQPNLAHVGLPFNINKLAPGFPLPRTVGANTRNPGKMYQDGVNSGAQANPAGNFYSPAAISPGREATRQFVRMLASTQYVLTGTSRDNTGAVLATCQVMVFSTVDRSLIAETVSDGSGAWSVPVTRGWPFFLVEYKAGAPDVAGTSLNTLVPNVV